MRLRVGRRDPRSLLGGYGTTPARYLRDWLARRRRACWRLVVAVSPVHFDDGDMRRAYRWTWAVVALVAACLLALAGRLALTWGFTAFVTAAPPAVAAFNLAVSVAAGAAVAAVAALRAWVGRRRHVATARMDRL